MPPSHGPPPTPRGAPLGKMPAASVPFLTTRPPLLCARPATCSGLLRPVWGPKGGDKDENTDRNGAPSPAPHTHRPADGLSRLRRGRRRVLGLCSRTPGLCTDHRTVHWVSRTTGNRSSQGLRLPAGTPQGSGESSSQAPPTPVTMQPPLRPRQPGWMVGLYLDQGPESSFDEARPARHCSFTCHNHSTVLAAKAEL